MNIIKFAEVIRKLKRSGWVLFHVPEVEGDIIKE